MPDEVIVGKKDYRNAGPMPGFDLAQHLLDRFEAHLAAEDDDDVAELAAERAPARALNDAVRVTPAEQVQAGRRRVRHMDFLGLHVMVGRVILGVLAQEARPAVLGLALEKYIAMGPAYLGQKIRQRPAQNHRLAALAKLNRMGQDVGLL